MTDFLRRFGQWGMVAGAAEGIGAAFCEEFARRGMNVILIDVKGQEMEILSGRLEKQYKIQTRCFLIDLGADDSHEKCMEALYQVDCRLLVYNAAYSRVKPFLTNGIGELDQYIGINVRTPLKLAYLFARRLRSEAVGGGIILMSSLAGLWGTNLVAAYSGTKAFNLALAEALHQELKSSRIAVSAVCAGATATPGYLDSKPASGFISPPLMKPEKVASIALKKLGKKTVIIPGFRNKMSFFLLARLMPRSLSSEILNRTMRRTYRDLTI
jgi:short-subunit dehydrogenase